MAKTTKSTKRPSSARQKKGSLSSKINFKSRKTQFFTVIVLVALMGAGWFTYRSFAASNVATLAAAAVADSNGSNVRETKTGKSGITVKRLSPGQSLNWTVAGNTMVSGARYRFCASARYENPSPSSKQAQIGLYVKQLMGTTLRGQRGVEFGDLRYAFLANDYVGKPSMCTRWFTGWGRDAARFTVKNNGPSTARIGSVVLERQ